MLAVRARPALREVGDKRERLWRSKISGKSRESKRSKNKQKKENNKNKNKIMIFDDENKMKQILIEIRKQ